MIVRFIIFVSLFLFLGLFALLNPLEKPKPIASHLIKISQEGKRLPAWSGPWRCVFDSNTHLLWEVKSYAEDLQDKQCSFSWFNGREGVAKKGDCFIEGEGSDTQDLINFANAQQNCGVKNWRLPTQKELESLLFKEAKVGEPLIEKEYFPYTHKSLYWTADSNKTLKGVFSRFGYGGTLLNFLNGKVQDLPYQNAGFVRLVASEREIE